VNLSGPQFLMRTHGLTFFAAFLFLPGLAAAQIPEPRPQPPAAPESTPAPQPASGQNSSSKPHRVIPAFLILGTVFNEKAYAFPGVEVKIRRKGEKKFRYDLYTNSLGEFAVRVPDGIEYEVVVRQKKYKEQSQEVLANMADVQKRLTFKLEAIAPPKTGESK
jgi:hypothetical protein